MGATTSRGPRDPATHPRARSAPPALVRAGTVGQQYAVKGLFSVWLFVLFAIGLHLFAGGFLLSRSVLDETSTCEAPPVSPPGPHYPGETVASTADCWYPARYQKAVIVVIDALRFDFTTPFDGRANDKAEGPWGVQWPAEGAEAVSSNSSTYPPRSAGYTAHPNSHYHNHLPVLTQLQRQHPQHTQLFRFLADPPTTTLQRLKGLTTGTLPTFIDLGSNFSGAQIDEDNWLLQFLRHRNATNPDLAGPHGLFAGDDTWMSLFPHLLAPPAAAAYPFPSFNVWDLHTLDNGVLEVLTRQTPLDATDLKRYETAAEAEQDAARAGTGVHSDGMIPEAFPPLTIAHFLGVDHCGHRFGPDHPAMAAKLDQMNTFLERLAAQLDNDTLLVVMGDHGMDLRGDHGGDSPQELEAALFLYAKGAPLVDPAWLAGPDQALDLTDLLTTVDAELGDTALAAFVRGPNGQIYRSISQTDLVPTLSLLLGLPIPFNNLGTVVPELFSTGAARPPTAVPLAQTLRAAQLNAHQLDRYFAAYMQHTAAAGLDAATLGENRALLQRADADFAAYLHPSAIAAGDRRDLARAALASYLRYTRTALITSRQRWAQFDGARIGTGLLVLFMTCVATVLMAVRIARSRDYFALAIRYYEPITLGSLMGALLGPLTLRSWAVTPTVWTAVLAATLGPTDLGARDTLLLGAAIGSCIGWYAGAVRAGIYHGELIDSIRRGLQTESATRLRTSVDIFVLTLVLLCHLVIFASNSFVVYEDHVVRYLLQTLMAYLVYRAGSLADRNERNATRAQGLTVLALTRLTAYVTVCREEQGPTCVPTFYASEHSTTSAPHVVTVLLAAAVVAPHLVLRFLQRTRNDHGLASLWHQFGLRLVLLLGASYWLVDLLTSQAEVTVASGEPENPTTTPAVAAESPVDLGRAWVRIGATFTWHTVKLILARLVFGLTLVVGPIAWYYRPYAVTLEMAPTSPRSSPSSSAGRAAEGHTGAMPASRDPHPRIVGLDNMFGASYLTFFAILFPVLVLVQLPMGGLVLYTLWLQTLLLFDMMATFRRAYTGDSPTGTSTLPHPDTLLCARALVLGLLSWHGFFTTGHQAVISSIQWTSAFVGLSNMHLILSGLLVTVNTLGSFIVVGLAVPLGAFWRYRPEPGEVQASDPLPSRVGVHVGLYLLYHTLVATMSAVFAAVFKRHLMVWKIFAPRFMLSGPVVLVSCLVTALFAGGWVAYRVTLANRQILRALGAA
ncbi:mannose-ethanolamine phosphotransferase gpi13 [Tieghemiomyces parasiticus]|uniref:Mannose-ethanolamine phosphotransferase gpi13 n=1 Tax=Tieghemiomyces parasiticus TaxID=78921 RepID=A0A9W8E3B7_9FUNG|nr:mannose-ethanolamine phosphotransferase gpi13 [Tieghemiomyces parasiticus]